MKKFLGIISLATIALAGCTKTDVEVAAPSTVAKTIYASVNTKTVNDGLSTKWAKGDAISVFFAEEGDDAYSTNAKFEISNIETGAFTGTAPTLEEGVAYDWFAYYPYTSQKESPATNKGWMTVGSAASASQVQKGNSSKAHLAGENYPLIGKAASVPAEDDVVFQMEQATAVVAINVTNSASANLQVATVEFTAEEDIVGTYYINIAGDKPIYTGSGDKYVSKVAKLTVQNGEALASGESATFYIGVKPFTAASGKTLKISVNGYEKAITLTKDVKFERGVIKSVKFDYEESEETGTVVFMNEFSGTEGFVNGDNNISYKAEKGGASTDPALFNGEIRVYQKGGLFTVSANNDAKITKIILGSSMTTSVTYSIDGGDDSAEKAIAANDKLTVDNLDATSVKFTCKGTDKDSRLYVNYLSVTYTGGVEPLPVCADPVASIEDGEIVPYGQTVTLTTETEGATIYYTLDSKTPTHESSVYSSPIAIVDNVTLTAIASKDGYTDSAPVIYKYKVLECAVPTVSVAAGPVAVGTTVELACATPGSVIYWKSEEDSEYVEYSSAIVVSEAMTISAYAEADGYKPSQVVEFEYSIKESGKYTALFGSAYNSKSVSGYEDSFSSTTDGFKVNVVNFNNNGNNWDYIKAGRKGNASVATISTDVAIVEAIKTVTVTIDAITKANVNSIKLYSGTSAENCTVLVGEFDKSTGDKVVTIATPTAGRYYKLEFDCASGSSNGLVTVSKVVFDSNN